MPSLSNYSRELDYAYAPGFYPTMECLLHRPEDVRRVLLHSKAQGTEAAEKLISLAAALHVRVEIADKALARLSQKENCFAAAVFSKRSDRLDPEKPHVVLHSPSDCGNIGTILRTALGFGVEDIALIRPCADVYDPRTIRASMGSLFQLRVCTLDQWEAYPAEGRALYPFMLDGSRSLPDILAKPIPPRWSLIFGNEGSGLPGFFSGIGQPIRIPSNQRIDSLNLSAAAAIAIYSFVQAVLTADR